MKIQGVIIIFLSFFFNMLNLKRLACSCHNRQALYQLHAKYAKEILIATNRNDQEMAQRYTNRIQAIIRTIATLSPNTPFSLSLRTSNSTLCKLGEIYGSELYDNFFVKNKETPLNQELQAELTTTLQETTDLVSQSPQNPYVQAHALLIYNFIALAQEQSNLAIALLLSDLCFHVKRATKKLTGIIAHGAKIITHGISQGINNYVDNNFKHTFETIKNNADQQISLKTLYREYVRHIHDAGTALLKALQYAYQEPLLFSQEIKTLTIQLKQTIQNHPEAIIALIVEILIPAGISKLIPIQNLEPLINTLKDQSKKNKP